MADSISRKLDCLGLMCPMPVVKTRGAIKLMEIGELLEMISSDPGSMPDMKAWAKQTGHELQEAEEVGKNFRFVIKKTH